MRRARAVKNKIAEKKVKKPSAWKRLIDHMKERDSCECCSYLDGDTLVLVMYDVPVSANMRYNMKSWMKNKVEAHWDLLVARARKNFRGDVSRIPKLDRCALSFDAYRNKLIDHDNNAASSKDVIDALVDMMVLKDDKPSIVTCAVFTQQKVEKGDERTIIRLTPLRANEYTKVRVEICSDSQSTLTSTG